MERRGTRNPEIEVHKFGGASLADAAAYRHAASIVKGRQAPCVVVVSAPAGVTDALLALATRAVAGERKGLDEGAEELRRRYRDILKQSGKGKGPAAAVGAEIDRSFRELESLLSSLVALKELTPRTRDFVVSRGERLSAAVFTAALAGAGLDALYVDATEIVFTDGPFGGAFPN